VAREPTINKTAKIIFLELLNTRSENDSNFLSVLNLQFILFFFD